MKFLFVAYCFGNAQGQALIGVYKRGLRVALALEGRGHTVAFFCPGRENFHDALTAQAEERLEFVDFDFDDPVGAAAEANRQRFRAGLTAIAPDVVVIGEAPLSGPLLEATLSSVELGIPVVVLDNAYQPGLVDLFCRTHAPLLDGLILTGPTSFYAPDPPAYLAQVPPYIEASAGEARTLLAELDLSGERLV